MATPTKSTKKVAKKTTATAGKRTQRKRSQRFNSYLSKVLKGASKPKLTLSSKSMKIVHSLVTDLFDRLATEAAALARSAKKRTLGSREMQTAVRLTLPAELAKHAMAEGTRAVAKATSS
jgi:histone H3/H4